MKRLNRCAIVMITPRTIVVTVQFQIGYTPTVLAVQPIASRPDPHAIEFHSRTRSAGLLADNGCGGHFFAHLIDHRLRPLRKPVATASIPLVVKSHPLVSAGGGGGSGGRERKRIRGRIRCRTRLAGLFADGAGGCFVAHVIDQCPTLTLREPLAR